MKTLEFSYAMQIAFSQPAFKHCFSLRCLPFDTPCQNIREMFVDIHPNHCLTETTDGFGNRVLTDRITEPHEDFSVFVSGTANIDFSLIEPEPLNLIYKYPSPHTACGEQLTLFKNDLLKKLENLSTHEKAEKIMQEIYNAFSYVSGATNIHTTAEDAWILKKGVCQDYAHIFIALCRSLSIPARYVVGIPKGIGETHAWAEIYDTDRWYGFDPTNNKRIDESYLKLSHGRDFGDCGVNRGVLIGGGVQKQTIETKVTVVSE